MSPAVVQRKTAEDDLGGGGPDIDAYTRCFPQTQLCTLYRKINRPERYGSSLRFLLFARDTLLCPLMYLNYFSTEILVQGRRRFFYQHPEAEGHRGAGRRSDLHVPRSLSSTVKLPITGPAASAGPLLSYPTRRPAPKPWQNRPCRSWIPQRLRRLREPWRVVGDQPLTTRA